MQEEDKEVANMRRIKRWTVMGMLWVLLGLLVVAPGMPLAGGVALAAGVAENRPVCSARSSGLAAGKTARTTGSPTFQKAYGTWAYNLGFTYDFIYDVAGPLDDGGFLLVGWTNDSGGDTYVVRIDGNGDRLWARAYGGDYNDRAEAVVGPLADGGFLLVGYTNSFGAGAGDMYAVRIDSSGAIQWSRAYGGEYTDSAHDVAGPLADGGFLLVGEINGEMAAVRIDGSGNGLWSRTYGAGRASGVVGPLADGGFLLVGFTGAGDLYAVRIDGSGKIMWGRTYKESMGETWASDVVGPLADGNFLIVGTTGLDSSSDDDMYAIRIDGLGNLVWSRTYGGTGDDTASAVVGPLADGGFLLVGSTESFGAGSRDMYAVRINGSGNVLWSRTYGGDETDYASAAVALADGGFLLVGTTASFEARRTDMYVVRTDSSGTSGCNEMSVTSQIMTPTTQVTSPTIQLESVKSVVTPSAPHEVGQLTMQDELCFLREFSIFLPLVQRNP